MSREFRDFSEPQPALSGPSKATSGPELSLDPKRLLFKQTPLMLAIILLLAIPGMLLAWFAVPLEYEAYAVLQFSAVTPKVLNIPGVDTPVTPYDKFVTTQMALIRNDSVLQAVLDNQDVASLAIIKETKDPLTFLKKSVQVQMERNSELVRVLFSSTDRAAARTIVAAIVSSYLDYTARSEKDSGGKRMETLLKARESFQGERERQLSTRNELARRLEAPSQEQIQMATVELQVQRESLMRNEENLGRLRGEVARTTEMIEQLKALAAEGRTNTKLFDFEIEAGAQADGRVVALRNQLMAADNEMQRLLVERVQDSPSVKSAKQRRDAISGQLSAMESQARSEVLSSLIAKYQKELDATKREAQDVQQRTEELTKQIQDLKVQQETRAAKSAASNAELAELDSGIEELGRRLAEVRQQIDSLTLESNAPARIQVASQANVPDAPDMGKRLRLMAVALMGALMAGIGTGVFRELADRNLYSPKDVRSLTDIQVIAAIPHIDEDPVLKSVSPHLVAARFPYSSTANEYRRILAQIAHPPAHAASANTVLVVSPSQADGKSSIICNLAVSLAYANRRVLVIDTCCFAPKIEECFGMERGPGLSEILYRGADPLSLVRPAPLNNLDVLGPGMHAEDVSSKLASREMLRTLEVLGREYSHILMDSVPGLLMSDAKLLAPIAEHVLIVVGAGVSDKGMLRRLTEELRQVNADIIGVVINKIRIARGGYLKQNLEKYYGYSGRGVLLQQQPRDLLGLIEAEPVSQEGSGEGIAPDAAAEAGSDSRTEQG